MENLEKILIDNGYEKLNHDEYIKKKGPDYFFHYHLSQVDTNYIRITAGYNLCGQDHLVFSQLRKLSKLKTLPLDFEKDYQFENYKLITLETFKNAQLFGYQICNCWVTHNLRHLYGIDDFDTCGCFIKNGKTIETSMCDNIFKIVFEDQEITVNDTINFNVELQNLFKKIDF